MNSSQTPSGSITSLRRVHWLRRLSQFITWRKMHLTDSGFVLFLSFMLGVAAGVCAFLLKWLISKVTVFARGFMDINSGNWLYIILPVIGIILAAVYSRKILKANVSNGVSKLVADLNEKNYNLSPKTIYGSMVASALTLGFGGSAGSEGPIAYAGAGLGSRLGQMFRLTPQLKMILIGCGAAAGIAGIFKAPVGGALFTLEVLRIPLSTVTVLGIFLATIASALTAYILSGYTVDIMVFSPGVFDTSHIWWLVPLGVVCGLYSLYYTTTGALTKSLLNVIRNRWIMYISAGLTLGVMIFFFPMLYGEGYGAITKVINGDATAMAQYSLFASLHLSADTLIIILCIGMLLFKGIGSSAANNGGGVAGDFAPTLFAGCMLGLLYATAINISGISTLNAAHFALIAMAGSMAGIIRAPLMAMFIVTEMIGGFIFLLPTAIVSIISYCIVMIIKRKTFYHSQPFSSPDLS